MLDVDRNVLGRRIQELRIQRGWTQSFLGEGLCTPSMISQIESGKAVPSVDLLKKLVEKLGVALSHVIDRDVHLQARVQLELLKYFLQMREYDAAVEVADGLLVSSELILEQVIEVKFDKADALMRLGSSKESLEMLLGLESDLKAAGDLHRLAHLYNMIGNAYTLAQDLLNGYLHYEQAHRLSVRFDVQDILCGRIEYNLGNVLNMMGDEQKALAHFEVARKIFEDIQNSHIHLASTMYAMGLAYYNAGKLELAESYFSQARMIYEAQNILYLSQKVREENAFLVLAGKDAQEARQELLQCVMEFKQLGEVGQLVETYGKLASLALAQNNISEADYFLKLVDELPITEGGSHDPRWAFVFRVKAQYHLKIKQYQEAINYSNKSFEIFDRIRWVKESAKSLEVSAESYHAWGNPNEAFELSRKIISLLQDNRVGV